MISTSLGTLPPVSLASIRRVLFGVAVVGAILFDIAGIVTSFHYPNATASFSATSTPTLLRPTLASSSARPTSEASPSAFPTATAAATPQAFVGSATFADSTNGYTFPLPSGWSSAAVQADSTCFGPSTTASLMDHCPVKIVVEHNRTNEAFDPTVYMDYGAKITSQSKVRYGSLDWDQAILANNSVYVVAQTWYGSSLYIATLRDQDQLLGYQAILHNWRFY